MCAEAYATAIHSKLSYILSMYIIGWNDRALYPRVPRRPGRIIPAIKSYLIKPSAPSVCLKLGVSTTFPDLSGLSSGLFSDGFYHLVSEIP